MELLEVVIFFCIDEGCKLDHILVDDLFGIHDQVDFGVIARGRETKLRLVLRLHHILSEFLLILIKGQEWNQLIFDASMLNLVILLEVIEQLDYPVLADIDASVSKISADGHRVTLSQQAGLHIQWHGLVSGAVCLKN